jgi:predicted aspartyl protease
MVFKVHPTFYRWTLGVAYACILLHVGSAQTGVILENGPDEALKQYRLEELRADLSTMKDGSEKEYFEGMLASRVNHFEESIESLNRAMPSLRETRPDRAAVALQALVDDYEKSFRYADAAKTDNDLLSHFASLLSHEELKGAEDNSDVLHILQDAPAQTIRWNGPVRLETKRDPLGDVEADLTVNGVRGSWLLDTGANMSVVSASFAKRLGLTLLSGAGQTQAGLTGIENPLRIAILPSLQLDGAMLHNVVLLVLDDANLNVVMGKEKYQINAALGYPVFQSLGTITFLNRGEFVAGDSRFKDLMGTHMYLEGLTPVIECRVDGVNIPLTFDTGATRSVLFDRYYNRFQAKARTWIKGTANSVGAGGPVKRKVYLQPKVDLGVGERTAVLRRITIYTNGTGTALNHFYGNLGQDMVSTFDSFTLDFKTMTFSLGEPVPKKSSRSSSR